MNHTLSHIVLTLLMLMTNGFFARAGVSEIRENQLFVDATAQPQLWGAEIQYFRLRGGEGRNVPRSRVLELWNKALDRAREAKMNTIGFYIPWDFHEYADGKYDFDGTVDEDGDGNPDYPSRDVRTWLKLVEAHGFKNIHVRPGPYINAEWGFLGFGAIPLWFHEKFPDSHTRNSKGQRTALYSYSDPDYRTHAKRWLEVVYRDVLKPYIGPQRLVTFLQIDNETNLMWQSMYNHDYGARSLSRYRDFLKQAYGGSLARLNIAHGRTWVSWTDIEAPRAPGQNLAEDQDWYRFQDEDMHQYLIWVRSVWEGLGVREPSVLFTLAESYNAPGDGVLPNYKYRNDPGKTGMMTVNLYPKVYETADKTLMNLPFKTDHDVKAADSASDFYLGSRQEWVMGPEIQAGWWRGTDVTPESRRQTYLSVLGHGLKALFLYYFNEGQNWDTTWAKNQIEPYYKELRKDKRFETIPEDQLPEDFWRELDEIVADHLFAGWNTRHILWQGGIQTRELDFDAPLDADAEPRPPYQDVKELGEKVMAPYGAFLGTAVELTDDVCMIKDVNQHAPTRTAGVNSLTMNVDWAGGLLALLMHAGVNPRIIHWGLNPAQELDSCRLIVYQDNGFATPELANTLRPILTRGAGLLSFLDTGLINLLKGGGCTPLPTQPMDADGFRCPVGRGLIVHARVPIHDVFNTDFYSQVVDAPQRRAFIETRLRELRIEPKTRIKDGGDRVVAFTRVSPDHRRFWVTVKSGRLEPTSGAILLREVDKNKEYLVSDVFAGTSSRLKGSDIQRDGFPFALGPSGSTAFFIEPK